jgi:hypothetical protein
MITFTAIYASVFAGRATPDQARFMFMHMGVQSAFTIAAHIRELRNRAGEREIAGRWWIAGLGLTAAALLLTALAGPPQWSFEAMYRVVLGAYGLFFPAYAWLCMIPTWRSPREPSRRAVVVWIVASALAAPSFYVAFIEGDMWWVAPGLGVILMARFLIGHRASQAD